MSSADLYTSLVEVAGVPILRTSLRTILDGIAFWTHPHVHHKGRVVCLVNAFSLVEAHRNPAHMMALRESDMCLADGWPIARMARTPRIAGADLMLAAARHPELGKMRHVLLGGFGVAYKAAIRQWKEAGGDPAIREPWMRDVSETELVRMANLTRCDILWVALGCPRQEIWMHENRDKLRAKVIIGVGAAFDFLAGRVRRAPVWVQRIGLEWAWRIAVEPQRWRRQVGAVIGFARLMLSAKR